MNPSRWKRVPTPVLILAFILLIVLFQWRNILTHPLLTIFISVCSAILLPIWNFARRVWTSLEERWVRACADWIDAQLRLLLSGYRRRYYRQLHYRHRAFNVRGLRTQGQFSLELPRPFVDLCMQSKTPQETSADPIHVVSEDAPLSIWDLLTRPLETYRCLAIIGPPGSGKTTLLQHLALTFAANIIAIQRTCFAGVQHHTAHQRRPELASPATTL